MELLALFAKHLHVQVTVGFNPVLVDFDRERPNESQSALLVGEDSDDMGSAFDLLIKPLKHIGAFEMFVVFSGQPVKSKGFLDVLFHPRAELLILFLPAQEPGGQISAGFGGVAPVIKPPQFHSAIVAAFARQIVERIT